MTLQRPKTCQTFPGLEGSAGGGTLGLGVFLGLCLLPWPDWLCAATAQCKQTKNSDGMFLAISCSHFGWALCIFFPPNGYISNIRPVQLHLGFFSWHYLVLADCKQSSSCALWPPESQLGVVGNTPGPTCTKNFKLEHFT